MVKLESTGGVHSKNPPRLAQGTVGRSITVNTNIFPITAIADAQAFQYDVVITPDVPVVFRKLWPFIESQVRKIRPELKGALLAYDGRRNAFSTADICEMGEKTTLTVDYDRSADEGEGASLLSPSSLASRGFFFTRRVGDANFALFRWRR